MFRPTIIYGQQICNITPSTINSYQFQAWIYKHLTPFDWTYSNMGVDLEGDSLLWAVSSRVPHHSRYTTCMAEVERDSLLCDGCLQSRATPLYHLHNGFTGGGQPFVLCLQSRTTPHQLHHLHNRTTGGGQPLVRCLQTRTAPPISLAWSLYTFPTTHWRGEYNWRVHNLD